MSETVKRREKDIEFIKDLVSEMVHNRCFCNPGSREFVEFDSVDITALNFADKIPVSEIYSAKVVVRFSGEPQTFPIVIKLIPDSTEVANAFELFQNEELFYSKIAPKIGISDHLAKCYVADMGRYGKPVIVLEDLRARGYAIVEGKLTERHLELWAKAAGIFHGRGLRLRNEEPSEFREFYAKLQEGTFNEENREAMPNVFLKKSPFRGIGYLKSLPVPDSEFIGKVENRIGKNPYDITRELATEISEFSTLCHGDFGRDNLLFKNDEAGNPVHVKLIDWQTTRFCPVGVDLGPVIFTNLGIQDRVLKVERLIEVYLDSVQLEYSTLPRIRMRKDIVSKLIFAYNVASFCVPYVDKELALRDKRETLEQFVEAVCSFGGREADEELGLILCDLKTLGTFDS